MRCASPRWAPCPAAGGLFVWAADRSLVEWTLAHGPHAVMLSLGDPRPIAKLVKAAGCRLICQVQDLAGARLACEAGADLVVPQGTEAGGHGGTRSSASACCVSADALADAAAKQCIASASGHHTKRTHVFDVVRICHGPEGDSGRAAVNRFVERWRGRERALAATLQTEAVAYRAATQHGDFDAALVWTGAGVDLIKSVAPAAWIVRDLAAEAEARLTLGERLRQRQRPR